MGCVLLLCSVCLGVSLGVLESFGLSILFGTIVAVFLGWLLARCAWRPTLAKWRKEALPISVVVGTVCIVPYASAVQWDLFLFSRRASLEALAKDVVAYGKIRDMSNGLRHRKSLNGKEFDASDSKVGEHVLPALDEALRANGIDPSKYHEFRAKLTAAGLIEFEVKEQYVAFLKDGLLDNLVGVLWVRPNQSPPSLGSTMFNSDLVSLRDMGGGWYVFGTT